MKRQKNEGVTTRVYSYGTVPSRVAPVFGGEAAHFQLRLAKRLWNLLVKIERTRMERYRRIMSDETQERIESLKARKAEIAQSIKDARKAARSRSRADTAALQAEASSVRAAMAGLIEERKQSKDRLHNEKRTELDAMRDTARRRIKRARQAAAAMGLFWGSYNDIVQRADAGRKLGELQFRRFTGEGTLTAQIMGGMPVARALAQSHQFLQIDPAAEGRKWRYARMRIGSNADRSPVWLGIPIVYHRDIPAGAQIKSASMTLRDGGWQLNITVNVPAPLAKPEGQTIALDIGWRKVPSGIRVSYWQDDAGKHGQVVVANSDISEMERAESLRSKCDLMREEFLPALAAWLEGQALPDEWTQKSGYIAQWRSGNRLCSLISWWQENRLADDREIFLAAQGWRKQYLHLDNWRRSLEERMRLRIREQYRIFAAKIATDYSRIVIEDFDMRDVAEKPQVTDQKSGNPHSSGQRQKVSPSVFRAALLNACKREGVEIVKVPSAYTTRECHACGSLREWNQEELIHRCECGALWDQDQNAAINLLRLWRASGGAAPAENQQDSGGNFMPLPDLSQGGPEVSPNV